MPLRRLGIYAESKPTKKQAQVQPARFSNGGVIGQFERKYRKVFQVNSATEAGIIFGVPMPAFYGMDFVNAFYTNVANVAAALFIKSHVGNTGTAIDAVVASAMVQDRAGSPVTTLKCEAAFQEELEYGVSGNRTGRKITLGYRFATTVVGTIAAAATEATLSSVAGVKIGDVMQFDVAGGPVSKKITGIDETNKKVLWSGAFHASLTGADGDTCGSLGIRIQTYRKSLTGVVTETDADLGKIYCSLEPEVTDFYVNNVHAVNQYMKYTDQVSATSGHLRYPASDSVVVYNTSGADGTAATTASHYGYENLSAFDNLPVRFLTNTESTLSGVNIAGEAYCQTRDDKPKWIHNIPASLSKAQKITTGQSYQRSDDVLGVICDNWLEVDDPFSNSPIAPPRQVPNVGFVMGAWIRAIETLGIHWIPAVQQIALLGCRGVVGTEQTGDLDRTDIANAGANCIVAEAGRGIVIKDFFTPSTTLEFMFANGILMREYFKVSIKDSLAPSVNTPNSANRIEEDKTAIYNFYRAHWDRGSTGNVPQGETFGQLRKADNTLSDFEEHVQIQADVINNPPSTVQAGQRNLDSWFKYPAPAGSIKIGVGLML